MRGSAGGPVCCDYDFLTESGCVAEAGFVYFFDEPLEGTKNRNTGWLSAAENHRLCL